QDAGLLPSLAPDGPGGKPFQRRQIIPGIHGGTDCGLAYFAQSVSRRHAVERWFRLSNTAVGGLSLFEPALAEFYGVNINGTDDFVKTTLGSDQRSGVLTHPYLLAAFSYQKLTSPIHRGVFLTRNIVGRALKPPPMAMTFKDADFASNLTMREKISQLTRPQACQACHSVINPLGFTLEAY